VNSPNSQPPGAANRPQGLKHAYALAMHDYLACSDEEALSRAYELGRQALTHGMGPLDLLALHQSALEHVPTLRRTATERPAAIRATAFLMEALSPFEMTYRSFLDRNTALSDLNEALENESRRTARRVHDGAGQMLFSVQLALSEAMIDLPQELKPPFEHVVDLANQLDQQLRSLSHDLYPVSLDDLGLNRAIQHLLEGVSSSHDLKSSFHSSLPDEVPPGVAFCLYQCVQEAVTNIVRHAHATSFDVVLEHDDEHVMVTVSDDGIGFDPARESTGGLGLVGIRDRLKGMHGGLDLKSAPGRGTQLRMTLPVTLGNALQKHQRSAR